MFQYWHGRLKFKPYIHQPKKIMVRAFELYGNMRGRHVDSCESSTYVNN